MKDNAAEKIDGTFGKGSSERIGQAADSARAAAGTVAAKVCAYALVFVCESMVVGCVQVREMRDSAA